MSYKEELFTCYGCFKTIDKIERFYGESKDINYCFDCYKHHVIKLSDMFEKKEDVNHPSHYNDGKIEAISVIEDWSLGFCLGNTVKYICRAGKKKGSSELKDLEKAKWYLERHISKLKENKE